MAAATILTVEARHQSLLNILNAATSIPASFDMALSPSQVLAIAGGFITGCDLGIPRERRPLLRMPVLWRLIGCYDIQRCPL